MLYVSNVIADITKWQFRNGCRLVRILPSGVQLYVLTSKKLRKRFDSAGIVAFTIGENIFVRDRRSLTKKLIRHELEHVRQFRTIPLFPIRYLIAHWKHGYSGNPYEIVAHLAER